MHFEYRPDHFWEFGSFVCTGCHARHIRAEAGSVKTEASQPQVIDEGFLGFVESIKEGPLFYTLVGTPEASLMRCILIQRDHQMQSRIREQILRVGSAVIKETRH